MAALDLVSDYLTQARVLLQDSISPYRYSDAELIANLNLGITEARRIRADLFVGRYDALPFYTSTTNAVVIDAMYRVPFVYYIVGMAQLRDEEDVTDARASALLNKFVAQLLGTKA